MCISRLFWLLTIKEQLFLFCRYYWIDLYCVRKHLTTILYFPITMTVCSATIRFALVPRKQFPIFPTVLLHTLWRGGTHWAKITYLFKTTEATIINWHIQIIPYQIENKIARIFRMKFHFLAQRVELATATAMAVFQGSFFKYRWTEYILVTKRGTFHPGEKMTISTKYALWLNFEI